MKCVYHPSYQVALPPGHPFPMSKYSLLRDQLLAEGIVATGDILQPEALDASTLALVHTPEYLAKLAASGLSVAEQRRHASCLRGSRRAQLSGRKDAFQSGRAVEGRGG